MSHTLISLEPVAGASSIEVASRYGFQAESSLSFLAKSGEKNPIRTEQDESLQDATWTVCIYDKAMKCPDLRTDKAVGVASIVSNEQTPTGHGVCIEVVLDTGAFDRLHAACVAGKTPTVIHVGLDGLMEHSGARIWDSSVTRKVDVVTFSTQFDF